MKDNVVKNKSFEFAALVVMLCRKVRTEKREYYITKQLLKSGTSVGANIREAEYAESKADFKHKLSISQKEANESIYWIELLRRTSYISEKQFESAHLSGVEILKLLTSIIKTLINN